MKGSNRVNEVPRCRRLAAWSLTQAVWPPAALAVLAVAVISLGSEGPGTLFHKLALIIAIAAAIAMLAFSIILALDALLFRVMARL